MADEATKRLAMAALEKRKRGQQPTREERAALRAVERARDEQLRAEHYRTIPKRDWQRWSGRQQKTLNEQATRYGVPIGSATIDAAGLAKWLHDFLAGNARKLAAPDDDDPDLAGAASPALERYRRARALREERNYERDCGLWLNRRELRDAHTRIAGLLRVAGDALQRQFGAAAQKILNDALDDAQREVDRLFPVGPDAQQPQ